MIRPHRRRRGMTLIEMLVATAITLIMMGLVAQLFGVFGQGISGGRSVIELTDQMRSASWRLRQDLAGITAVPVPPLRPESEQGYLEIIEGPDSDRYGHNAAGTAVDKADPARQLPSTPIAITSADDRLVGDCDDILMFTARSPADPFVGRFENGTLESPTAEVAWFCKPSTQQIAGGPTLYTLYRRQLLVTAYVGAGAFQANGNQLDWTQFQELNEIQKEWPTFFSGLPPNAPQGLKAPDGPYDLSCRLETDGSGTFLRPNSLGDLTIRQNRFLHLSTFPHLWDLTDSLGAHVLTGDREGEDVVLSNVISFDVRVFDPGAPIQVVADTAVTPGDPGFVGAGGVAISRGCYVDLDWSNSGQPFPFPLPGGLSFPIPNQTGFQGRGVTVRAGPTPVNLMRYATYDTWSTSYDADGVDQDDDNLPDQGTNGFDDDGDGLIDEPDEAETSAPYPIPLRGLEIRIRCYEPSSRQVRQVTVRHTFVPY